VSDDVDSSIFEFQPLRPASRKRLLLGFLIGPVLWLVALNVVAVAFNYTNAIELGILVAFVSAAVATVGLLLLRRARIREEERYAARG
jgi:hypothetical protein